MFELPTQETKETYTLYEEEHKCIHGLVIVVLEKVVLEFIIL